MSSLPRRVGPYRVIDVIGRGGMGVVYRCEHAEIGETAAVKTVTALGKGLLQNIRETRPESPALFLAASETRKFCKCGKNLRPALHETVLGMLRPWLNRPAISLILGDFLSIIKLWHGTRFPHGLSSVWGRSRERPIKSSERELTRRKIMRKLFDSTLESLMVVGSFAVETHESELDSMRVVSIADVRADAEREADEEARRSRAA